MVDYLILLCSTTNTKTTAPPRGPEVSVHYLDFPPSIPTDKRTASTESPVPFNGEMDLLLNS